MSVTGAEPEATASGKWRPSIRYAAAVLLYGVVAASAMLAVGWAFNKIEAAIPGIPAEYANGPGFRTWPGWTEGYMRAHPIWFGFVFAVGFALVARGRASGSYLSAGLRGAGYGGLVFVVGSLPVFVLVYASFRVSLELVAVSWAARNLVQYLIAGVLVGLVARAAPPQALRQTGHAKDGSPTSTAPSA